MRTATYVLAGLGVLAWGTPIAIISRILLGYERRVAGLLISILLSDAPPYARLAVMCIGVLFSLVAPIWLRSRGHNRWALGGAIISLAVALAFVYVPAIIETAH
jgi:hypothetical protein